MWLIVFAGLFLSWSKPSLAKDYSIDRVNIKNVVSVDGSINVEEERIYNFEGSYSFAYQYINKKGERDEPYGLENFEVCDENKLSSTPFVGPLSEIEFGVKGTVA